MSIPEAERGRVARNKEWFDRFLQRIREVKEGPVVIVAASGGGSRAAIFTALVYETLSQTPIHPRNGSANEPRMWTDNIALISSVSGGSLATAYFVRNRGCGKQPRFTKLRNTTPDELNARLKGRAEQMLLELPKHQAMDFNQEYFPDYNDNWSVEKKLAYITGRYPTLLTARTQRMKDRKRYKAERDKEKDKLNHAPHPDEAGPLRKSLQEKERMLADAEDGIGVLEQFLSMVQAYDFVRRLPDDTVPVEQPLLTTEQWKEFHRVLESTMFDEMCLDFMAPLMRGALSPLILDRGDSLARFWTNRFDWYDCTNFDGFAECKYDETLHPLVIFNASDVAQGTRLAIGFPTLPSNLWEPVYDASKSTRARPITLSEWGPNYKVSLARAVRMSSNFPFGFRAMELSAQDSRGNLTVKHHVLDGGIVDNTGLDTIYELFQALEWYATKNERECHSEKIAPEDLSYYTKQAKTILQELRQRGVVILEIDAGAKPDERITGRLNLFAGLTEPIQALNNAAYMGADQDKALYIQELRRILNRNLLELAGDDPRKEVSLAWYNDNRPATTLHVALECNHYTPGETQPNPEVMTAWALGPKDKAEVVHRFLMELAWWKMREPAVEDDLHDGMADFNEMMKSARAMLRNSTPNRLHHYVPRSRLGGESDSQRKYNQSSQQKQPASAR